MKTTLLALSFLFASLMVGEFTPANAYSVIGHLSVCEIAWRLVTPAVRERILPLVPPGETFPQQVEMHKYFADVSQTTDAVLNEIFVEPKG